LSRDLVLVHGMWGASWHWDRYREFFESRGHRVLAPPLRHHDQPPDAAADPRLGTTSLTDFADDLERMIAGLGAKPVVIGHSVGGLLAQILAARGLAAAAVLLTPAAPAGIPTLRWSVVRAFASVYSQWRFWCRPVRQSFGGAAYSVYNLLSTGDQRATHARAVPESGRAIVEVGLPWLDRRRAAAVDPLRVTCPVLVVAGGRDRITPAAVVRRVAARYAPVATYREFPEHAHWVLGEPGWEDVAGCVHEWIASLPV